MSECVHHWALPSPDGRAVLPARCKHCGATRDFPTAWEPDFDKFTVKNRAQQRRTGREYVS